MVEKVNQLIKEIEVVEKQMLGMFTFADLVEDEETMKLMKTYVNLMQLSKEMMIEQAETTDFMTEKLNVIDTKLDLLLEK